MRDFIVAFVASFSTFVVAQTLAPVEATSILSWPTAIVAVLVAAAAGFFIGRTFGRNPAAEAKAQAEVSALFVKTLTAVADRIERHTTPATVVTTTAPAMTPEQVAAAQATIAHLQAQINQST